MKDIPIFDTHQHLIMANYWPYSWTKGLEPLEGHSFDYEAYLDASAGTGIAGTLFMETTPDDPYWNEETQYTLSMAANPDTLVRGVIANCRPEDEGTFEASIESIGSPYLKGLRRILHVVSDEISKQPAFVKGVRKIGEWDLTFDMCFFARQLPLALQLAKQCENTQFIIDHCGVPDIASDAFDPWREDIRALSELPNVVCKVSGVMAYCKPGEASATAVRPYVEHSIECFGWDRVVWGGDWPVCLLNTSLKSWVDVSRELVANESEDNQRKLFYQNAERIYKVSLT
ncbi:amidohydrolase [Rubellicoccus peritrichatus]|uniref:Amidohydrolase n=1 Tax=Rubellicoccus peritrichatus TaxID=3080537 RepID=A0AAQ3LFC6_9BACT|nr:amidohydrolase [Puniceicoccus sp. CR14]WOO42703.1 amidohydrolase [Puniceicoccus sp. CR14]